MPGRKQSRVSRSSGQRGAFGPVPVGTRLPRGTGSVEDGPELEQPVAANINTKRVNSVIVRMTEPVVIG
jgi:hypothetical protein